MAIVGGGLSGLTAAFRCTSLGYQATLFEAGKRLGGSLWTDRDGAFLIEHGAQSFDADSQAVLGLARELRLTDAIRTPRVTRSYGFDGRSLFLLDAGSSSSTTAGALGRAVATFSAGMGQLVAALATALAHRGEIRLDTPVRRLWPTARGWQLESVRGTGGEFDAVIIASGARTASSLLTDLVGAAALSLRMSRSVPVVSVSLAFARERVAHALDATGFIAGWGVELEGCLKCSFVSSTFEGRAPEGSALLRVFLRAEGEDLEAPLELFRERALRVVARVLGARGDPQRTWEARFREGFAVFDEEQARRVARVESVIAKMPLALSGTVFHGVGIDDAVRSAEDAVRKLRRLG